MLKIVNENGVTVRGASPTAARTPPPLSASVCALARGRPTSIQPSLPGSVVMDPSQPGPSNAAYAFAQPGGQLAAAYNPPPPAGQAPPGSFAAPAYATAPPAAAPQATPMYGQPPLPPPPFPPTQAFGGAPSSVALNIASRPTRQRRKPARYDEPNRATGPRPSKLKLNFSKKGVVGGRYSSFLGHYDREIDSDEEELEMEEHFILRMPGQGEADKLRALLRAKGKAKEGKKGKAKETAADESIEGVWFKFKGELRDVPNCEMRIWRCSVKSSSG